MARFCTSCGHQNELDKAFCTQCGTRLPAPEPSAEPERCGSCGAQSTGDRTFCTQCGAPLSGQAGAAPSPPPRAPAVPPAPGEGKSHSPTFALIVALLIPGGGQAYNGLPFRAILFLLSSVLVLPWIGSLFDAYLGAKRIVREGGRFGRGGFSGVFMQGWLAFDAALFVLIILTIRGVVQ